MRQLPGQPEDALQCLPASGGQGLRLVALEGNPAQHSHGLGSQVKAWVEGMVHTFEQNRGLDEHAQIGRQDQMVFAQGGGHIGQHLAQAELRQSVP